jgi:hypothetical protein
MYLYVEPVPSRAMHAPGPGHEVKIGALDAPTTLGPSQPAMLRTLTTLSLFAAAQRVGP